MKSLIHSYSKCNINSLLGLAIVIVSKTKSKSNNITLSLLMIPLNTFEDRTLGNTQSYRSASFVLQCELQVKLVIVLIFLYFFNFYMKPMVSNGFWQGTTIVYL